MESDFLWIVKAHIIDGDYSEEGTYEGTYTVDLIENRFKNFRVKNVPNNPVFQTFCLDDGLMITDNDGQVVSFYKGEKCQEVVPTKEEVKFSLAINVDSQEKESEIKRIELLMNQFLLKTGLSETDFEFVCELN